MKPNYFILILTVAAIVGAIVYLQSQKIETPAGNFSNSTITANTITMNAEQKAKRYEKAKEISTPDGFINTDSITINSRIGKKVVLVDFWTYSCINCQRTTPYLNAWYDKYKDQGLEIIGIHTPEFEFEKKYENVKKAVEQFGIKYPVVLDNDYSTWHAYENRYWPHKYLIDIDGFIVYDHIGEGGYDETERKIQDALAERMAALNINADIAKDIAHPAGTYEPEARSPEIYFGAQRNAYLGNGKSNTTGPQDFTEPTGIKTNILYLAGTWNIDAEFASNASADAKIIFNYSAKNVYMVASADRPVRVRVLLDGKPISAAMAGADVTNEDGASFMTIQDDRLYSIVKDPKGLSNHALELIIEDTGLKAFTFTFG